MIALALEFKSAALGGEDLALGTAESVALVQGKFGTISFGDAIDETYSRFTGVGDLEAPLPEWLERNDLAGMGGVGL